MTNRSFKQMKDHTADGERSHRLSQLHGGGMAGGRFAAGAHAPRSVQARTGRQATVSINRGALFRQVRRWSPGLFPPLLGLLLLAGIYLLASLRAADGGSIISGGALVTLGLFYVLAGIVYGILLYLAATDAIWWVVVALGTALYLVVTTGVLFGPFGGIVAALACGFATLWYGHGHQARVPAGHVALTSQFGAFKRTLQPGKPLLMPDEVLDGLIELKELLITVEAHAVDVVSPTGEFFRARAAATVACAIIPTAARTVAELGAPWNEVARAQIDGTLDTILEDWATRVLMGESQAPAQALTRIALAELRSRLRLKGIAVRWVKMRDVWLDARDRVPEIQPEAPPELVPEELPWADSAAMTATMEPPPSFSDPHDAGVSALDDALPMPEPPDEHLTPDVLSAAYEMVRSGQIHDPLTIRDIAAAFLRAARDDERSAEYPFDAEAAAEILMQRAQDLERQTATVNALERDEF